jgi:hypothetical protein
MRNPAQGSPKRIFLPSEKKFDFQIRSAIPLPQIEEASDSSALPQPDRERLKRFLALRWAKFKSD